MKKTLFSIIMIFSVLAAGVPLTHAQEAPYKFDFGLAAGMSGYLGDTNESNLFRRPGVAGSAMFRYISNVRWAFRGDLGVQTLSGNSDDFENVYPGLANYKFTSTVFDLTGRAEFNFLPYGIGETYKSLKRISPFVSAGVGCSLALVGDKGGTFAALSIPLGLGVKYKLRERTNLQAEFAMTAVVSDKMDGLVDLYNIKSSFLKNTDWYATLKIGITFEFGKRCETCHRID